MINTFLFIGALLLLSSPVIIIGSLIYSINYIFGTTEVLTNEDVRKKSRR